MTGRMPHSALRLKPNNSATNPEGDSARATIQVLWRRRPRLLRSYVRKTAITQAVYSQPERGESNEDGNTFAGDCGNECQAGRSQTVVSSTLPLRIAQTKCSGDDRQTTSNEKAFEPSDV